MKQLFIISLLIAMLLPLTTSCGKDEVGEKSEQGGNQGGSMAPIIVTVYANGKANGGHQFVNIDGVSFYIDDIKYTASNGNLIVTGYNEAFFSGKATIISQLNYNGHEMHVVEIGDKAFHGRDVLTSLIISKGITSIGQGAFQDCRCLTSIAIPEGLTLIEYAAFAGCTALTSVIIPSSVAHIGQCAFRDCTGLTSVTISEGIADIGSSAFEGCTGLSSVVIPSSVTSIKYGTFAGCTGLTSVTIPSSVTRIEKEAFKGTPYYKDQPDGVFYIGNIAYTYKGTMPENTSIIIKEGTKYISEYAFEDQTNLTSITIPESVTSIGYYAFSGTGLTSVTIPSSVTSIEGYVFYDCRTLTSVTIPSSVTSIKEYAFAHCWGLTSVSIPSSVTCIREFAFLTCTSLTTVIIPSSVTSIGDYAFRNCSNLTDVYCYAEMVPNTGWNVFCDLPPVHATLHVPASAIDAYRNSDPWRYFWSIVTI